MRTELMLFELCLINGSIMRQKELSQYAEKVYNELTEEEVQQYLANMGDVYHPISDDENWAGESHEWILLARKLEAFARVVATEGTGVHKQTENYDEGAAAFAQRLEHTFYSSIMRSSELVNSVHRFTEEAELVRAAIQECMSDLPPIRLPESMDIYGLRTGRDYFREIIGLVERNLRNPEYAARTRRRKEKAKANYRSGCAYIFKLFARHNRLLVVRVDLGYRGGLEGKPGFDSLAAFKRIRADLARLFNNMRANKIFDHSIGKIAKLEYGLLKGFHYHMFFFFNGDERHQHDYIAQMIGKYWVEAITKGDGLAHNCNRRWTSRRGVGIGMVHFADARKHVRLLQALAYVTKSDQYLRLQATDGDDATPGRTGKEKFFIRGSVKDSSPHTGRPRGQVRLAKNTSVSWTNGAAVNIEEADLY